MRGPRIIAQTPRSPAARSRDGVDEAAGAVGDCPTRMSYAGPQPKSRRARYNSRLDPDAVDKRNRVQQLAISRRPFSYAAQVGLLAALYFAVAKLSLLLAIPPGYATAVWPPSGLAVAAILLAGNRMWPGIWLGAALANLTVQASAVAAVLIGTGNALEALVGAALIQRFIGVAAPLRKRRGRVQVRRDRRGRVDGGGDHRRQRHRPRRRGELEPNSPPTGGRGGRAM